MTKRHDGIERKLLLLQCFISLLISATFFLFCWRTLCNDFLFCCHCGFILLRQDNSMSFQKSKADKATLFSIKRLSWSWELLQGVISEHKTKLLTSCPLFLSLSHFTVNSATEYNGGLELLKQFSWRQSFLKLPSGLTSSFLIIRCLSHLLTSMSSLITRRVINKKRSKAWSDFKKEDKMNEKKSEINTP